MREVEPRIDIATGLSMECVVTHPGRSQYSRTGGGVSACGLAALNCARIVLGLHVAGLGSSQLVQELMKRTLLEDILKPCLSWSSPAHLAVEELYMAPIFRSSLKLLRSDYGKAGGPFFQRVITNIYELTEQRAMSSCVIITRPPEIIACLCIADVPGGLFVIFDSHPRPETHPDGAAFIFKNSIQSTAEYLTELLRFDENLINDRLVQWEAQLLSHCSGEIFVARTPPITSSRWGEIALDASLQGLSHQAQVREVESRNDALEKERRRLSQEVSDLNGRLSELTKEVDELKAEKEGRWLSETTGDLHVRPYSPESSVTGMPARDAQRPPMGQRDVCHPDTHPQSTNESTIHEVDPLAAQLQKEFDEENKQLERQLQRLKIRQPGFFDCGVCLERYQEDHVARVMPCGHLFCRSCLRDYVVSKINDHRYPVLCPTCTADRTHGSNPGELDDSMIEYLGLTNEQFNLYNELQIARFSTIVHCRRCTNTFFVDIEEYRDAKQIICPIPKCGYVWCKTCSQPIAIGGAKHSCDGSSELKHLMDQRGWKHCPGCQTPAEKVEGCNHMTCMSPGCNTHFCYTCGESIVKSLLPREIQSAVSKHYRKCTLF